MSGKGSSVDAAGGAKELVSNVQVCARIRPLSTNMKSKELEGPSAKGRSRRKSQNNDNFVAWDISEDKSSVYQSSEIEKVHGRINSYTLDRVFGTDVTTDQVYNDSVASLVKRAMEGYNSTVLAYGQTSTGKTHTMTGKRDDPGLIPLCVKDCFKYVQDNESNESREYLFRFSYLEIYKENIRDLLSSSTSAPQPVRLFDGPDGLVIRGVKEVVVSSPNKVFQLLKQGDKKRQVGATHMNQQSSRSHVVVRLKIESSLAKNKSDETRISTLSLVDLAGSESVRLNGTERREEGQYINKSLMALGQVVLGLSESSKPNGGKKSKSFIPYRDSKLTRLLQSSLSGNAQMLLLCCISPLVSYLEESHNTFKFATRAKRIEQKASIQTAKDKEATLLQTYRNEIEQLRQQLAEASQQKEQLLEEQQAFQTMMRREQEHSENSEPDETTITSSSMKIDDVGSDIVDSTSGEIEELVDAIQRMEHLILKSHPLDQHQEAHNEFFKEVVGTAQNDVASLDIERDDDLVDTEESESTENSGELDTPPKSPEAATSAPTKDALFTPSTHTKRTPTIKDSLHSELSRVRGLLSSVLQTRGVSTALRNDPPGVGSLEDGSVRKNLNFHTPSSCDAPPSRRIMLDQSLSEELEVGNDLDRVLAECDDMSESENDGEVDEMKNKELEEKDAELESLRIQLHKQERTTSLRKADSNFLQRQLEEKDKLLEEVSSLLEAVEKRQVELERENLSLRKEIKELRFERGEDRGILMRTSPF